MYNSKKYQQGHQPISSQWAKWKVLKFGNIHVGLKYMYPIPSRKRASKTETQDRRCNLAQGRGDHKSWCSSRRNFYSMTEAHGKTLFKPTPCKQTVNVQLPQVFHSLTLDHSEMTFYFFLLNKASLRIPIMYSSSTVKYYTY